MASHLDALSAAISSGTVKTTWKFSRRGVRIDDPRSTGHEPGTGILGNARVVADSLIGALIARFQMTLEGRGATQFDCTHDAPLCRRQRSTVVFTIGVAIETQHVGHFQLWGIHCSAAQSWDVGGFGSVRTGRGSRSSGLVEHIFPANLIERPPA
jgi:hypothetical protein